MSLKPVRGGSERFLRCKNLEISDFGTNIRTDDEFSIEETQKFALSIAIIQEFF